MVDSTKNEQKVRVRGPEIIHRRADASKDVSITIRVCPTGCGKYTDERRPISTRILAKKVCPGIARSVNGEKKVDRKAATGNVSDANGNQKSDTKSLSAERKANRVLEHSACQ